MYSACGGVISASGSVAERSKALVLGTSHFDGVGSNPTTASIFIFRAHQMSSFHSAFRSLTQEECELIS